MSTIQNLQTFDPFAADGEVRGSENLIHIRIQQRNGRKTVTTVQGIPSKYDLKKILKVLKKDFACNGTIAKHDEYGEVIQLSGDQREHVSKFLVQNQLATEKQVKVHGF